MNQPSLDFEIGYEAIQGGRAHQQDYCHFQRSKADGGSQLSAPLLAVLSDGMGGHVAGEVASRIACQTYIDVFASLSGAINQRLNDALVESNAAIGAAVARDPKLEGMGCTLLAAFLDQTGMRWMSVGDSALLYYRRGRLFRLNEDHSLGNILDRQAAAKIISEEQARNSRQRRSLRSALIGKHIALRDNPQQPFKLQPGDWVILASDGLEALSGDEIADILLRGDVTGSSPTATARALLQGVERKGVANQDNTTVMVVRVCNRFDPLASPAPPDGGHVDAPELTMELKPVGVAGNTVAAQAKVGTDRGVAGRDRQSHNRPPSHRDSGGAVGAIIGAVIVATAVAMLWYYDSVRTSGERNPPAVNSQNSTTEPAR